MMLPRPRSRASARWQPGDVVALRYITRAGGIGMSWPFRVVQDSDDLVALFIPRGASHMRWGMEDGRRRLVPSPWRRDVLRLMRPGEPFSVWLFWEVEHERSFAAYYINMEEPFRRSPIGFDTNDHMLDVVVAPDFTWRWKDQEEFEDRVRGGVYSEAFGSEVWEHARRAVELVERRASPFSDGWEDWTPDPSWDIPVLPNDWDHVPPVVWARSEWAYLDRRM
jgi:hypothetical protein